MVSTSNIGILLIPIVTHITPRPIRMHRMTLLLISMRRRRKTKTGRAESRKSVKAEKAAFI